MGSSKLRQASDRRGLRKIMELRFLGTETDGGQSPTLYATDRDSYLIQGWKVSDSEILAKLDIPEEETAVEIYARLMLISPRMASVGS